MKQVLNVVWIRLVKWLLMATVIIGTGYILNFILNNQPKPFLTQNSNLVQETQLLEQETAQEPAASMETLSLALEQRDIFSSKAAPSILQDQTQAVVGELPNNLKVVGILIGHPSQVIIEDTSLKQTYFISEGETQGGIRLEHVYSDKVVINYLSQDIAVYINQVSGSEAATINPMVNNVQIP